MPVSKNPMRVRDELILALELYFRPGLLRETIATGSQRIGPKQSAPGR